MLGAFVILVLVLAFFGIKFASAKIGNQPEKQPEVQVTEAITSEPEREDTSEVETTPTPAVEVPDTNLLEKNVYPQVNAIIQKYYKALGMKDVIGIKAVVDELDVAEEAKIANDQYLDDYRDVEVYTKKGLAAGDYVVLACYNYKFKDIDTWVPGLSQLYVRTRDDDSLYISMQEQDEAIQQHITNVLADADVQELIQRVQEDYARAQEEDESLRNFIANLGIASSAAAKAEDGATVTVRSRCNVRASASAEAEVIDKLEAGTQVVKMGTQGEWIQISFDDKTGYVRSDLFE